MPSPQLVIFDCDGVLVDSETLGHHAISATLHEMGVELSIEESARRFRGVQMSKIVLSLQELLGERVSESFVPDLRARMETLFRAELKPIEGVVDVLDQLSLPTCVVSNAPVEKLRLTLGLSGLLPRFEGRIYSAYEVGVWKPDPGLYLHAANAMGFSPDACVVVEDSPPGVEAAVAAGMRVLGYAPIGPGSDLSTRGATVFPHMSQLLALIEVH